MSAQLPAILAILGKEDHGPSDGAGSARCPHCGAAGRYVWRFLAVDGRKGGAMAGCLKLFPKAHGQVARLTEEAFDRCAKAAFERKTPATWWADITAAVGALESGGDVPMFNASVLAAESRRQAWLRRNGYGKYARRAR